MTAVFIENRRRKRAKGRFGIGECRVFRRAVSFHARGKIVPGVRRVMMTVWQSGFRFLFAGGVMGIFGDLKKGFQRNLNRITDSKIAKSVTGALSGIADASSGSDLKSRKSDLQDLPRRAGRYIRCQKNITEHLHFLVIRDEKKRREYQNMVKSLCGELDSIEREFFKVRDGFNFSGDDAKLDAEVAEFEGLLRPVIERHREVSEKLDAVIKEVNNFIELLVPLPDQEFYFSGTYDENEITILTTNVGTQKALWDNAQFQYKNPDIGLKEIMKAIDVSYMTGEGRDLPPGN